ncbi:hypothetical protein [Streptomyces cyanogenus]|uniref:hypothetical protein n=1 Tax=Streptomyces cyanogenus TaxID=80860 RepID=UPI001AA11E9F|nr:hypothetical protein [Streptomyces cyanogenus]
MERLAPASRAARRSPDFGPTFLATAGATLSSVIECQAHISRAARVTAAFADGLASACSTCGIEAAVLGVPVFELGSPG